VGNSTITVQDMVDDVSTIGDLNPVLATTGGFANRPALTIANDIFGQMFSERFPWKWNRMKLPPFFLVSSQQDYASLNIRNISWLENGGRVQLNSTQVPPPYWPMIIVRDLAISRVAAGWPTHACWFPNDQLEQGTWPGANVTYTNPTGQAQTPTNPWTNILDAAGNILVLTKWGTTGATAPVVPPFTPAGPGDEQPANYPVGVVVTDGTCEWTVADPQAQGIRVFPPPPNGSQANSWLVRLFAQKTPPRFTNLQQTLDPVPDDYSQWFRDGFVAYAHRYSAVPTVKAKFEQLKADWIAAMEQAA